MQILFLTQVLPYPLYGGAKIRAYYMLRYLAQSHQVTLVSFVREDDSPTALAHLEQVCTAVYTVPIARSRLRDALSLLESLVTGQPAVIIRDRVPAMRARLRQLIREHTFDVVHADQTAMAEYAFYAQGQSSGARPRVLLDQHNAMHLLVARQAADVRGWQQRIWRREAVRLQVYERELVRRADAVLTVTEEDRDAHLALFENPEVERLANRITAVPICVDPAEQPLIEPEPAGPHILHLGTMFWPPNVEGVMWFAEEILPRILADVPEAHFTVVGKNPPQAVMALAEPGSPVQGHVEVTGFVAEPQPYLARSRVFLVPVRAGGGMRVKILDGWQWGLPIVSTTIGAEGIAVRPGENILLADEPGDFAAHVVRLLREPAYAETLRRNGRAWVETHYNWRTRYAAVGAVYAQLKTIPSRREGEDSL